jgi:hypothetical protein
MLIQFSLIKYIPSIIKNYYNILLINKVCKYTFFLYGYMVTLCTRIIQIKKHWLCTKVLHLETLYTRVLRFLDSSYVPESLAFGLWLCTRVLRFLDSGYVPESLAFGLWLCTRVLSFWTLVVYQST